MGATYRTVLNFLIYFMKVIIYSFYYVCWVFVGVLDAIMNRLDSFANSQSPLNSAKLGRILWRQKIMTMNHMSPLDFLCLFRTRVKPEYVLKQNVSLFALTNKEAIFVETPDDVNIYSSEVHPFFMIAQYLNATHVIKMSISEFVHLADKIGDPNVPVIWMSNTGRCGGTMLTQMFESVPGTLAIDQPDAPTNLHFLYESYKLNNEDYREILKSIIRILCKPHACVERICIKPRQICTSMMTDISRLYPDITQLFIYRNISDTIGSYLAVMASDPYPVVLRSCTDSEWFSNFVTYFRNFLVNYFVSKRKTFVDVPHNVSAAGVLCYGMANYILLARDAISKDPKILPIKYEDILSLPRETLSNIFDHAGILGEPLHSALACLERDSQRGSPVGRDKVKETTALRMSLLDRVKCDAILSKYNLPRMGEVLRI